MPLASEVAVLLTLSRLGIECGGVHYLPPDSGAGLWRPRVDELHDLSESLPIGIRHLVFSPTLRSTVVSDFGDRRIDARQLLDCHYSGSRVVGHQPGTSPYYRVWFRLQEFNESGFKAGKCSPPRRSFREDAGGAHLAKCVPDSKRREPLTAAVPVGHSSTTSNRCEQS